ncbi:hypothetical protein [Caulobacter segnis]|uniref:Uncharacterized protein n=1 Tax=Caulobacter segnis TaxID=88688 RepID=A0A2W5V9B3_9CAUL|nr:hypothetical protein [Caulobacter segnis]PZR35782.1 MAG: hypothetical protein DI526_05700 [Caulobacter segnis]
MNDNDTPQSTDIMLGRIDGKLTALIDAFGLHRVETNRRFEKHEEVHEDHGERLTKLERFRWLIVGIASAVASVASLVLSAFLTQVLG